MIYRLTQAVLCGFLLLVSVPVARAQNYTEYDRLLRTYVDARGLVNYAGLKKELGALKGFVDQLGAADPLAISEPDERLRYYLTAYNAWVLYHAANAYPAKNEMWNFIGQFKNHEIIMGGKKSSLEYLEHQIIRPQFKDPRAHFYLNCAARSCPGLWQGAIPAGQTLAVLERAAKRFLNDSRNVQYDAAAKRLTISKIFDWFADDFLNYLKTQKGLTQPHIAQYILLYLDAPQREALAKAPLHEISVKYFSYDKSLNEQR
ncbi:MAG: DUF547 domain-containing protein [Acidobacteria bacterium]|nr:DUF547 domain-containing protein [Acidobacteriota bacterium]MBI3427644.1 DUF547 domain-containing protein [Acidobacteriota bacterium]